MMILLRLRRESCVLRDIALKIFFAEAEVENNHIEPLRINSEWVPEDIPSDIKRRIFNFTNEVR